ncbi:hypothetical protein [Hymenobacter fodinae]|uniref:Uncharacterized protein n=1 Tax=Hymenobacter fodinae TaxID=2510796 RepID=A0A4Z0P709_9BACT|nr:hypothetical protein [Hymenobacter fodinae]TGE07705.1 hypothetical protein EU556_08095 [Hymenobacter fodinae]
MQSYFQLAALAGLLLLNGCATTAKQAPIARKLIPVEIQTTNVGKGPGECTAFLLDYSIYETAKARHKSIYWRKDMEPGTQRYNLGPLEDGQTYYLVVNYNSGAQNLYPLPQPGEYLEAEIFADGKSVGKVRADQTSFTPLHYWGEQKGTKPHVAMQVQVKL